MQSVQVYLSIYPLGALEAPRVIDVMRQLGHRPQQLAFHSRQGAYWLEIALEQELAQFEPSTLAEEGRLLAEKLAVRVWRALGRYVRVVLEITLEHEEAMDWIMETDAYQRLMRVLP